MGARETFSFPSSYVELIIIFFHFPPVRRALDEQSLDGPSRRIAGDLQVNNQLHLTQKGQMKMKDNKACQFISFFFLFGHVQPTRTQMTGKSGLVWDLAA